MANDKLEQTKLLFPATWRDIPLFVPRGKVSGGRKATPRPIVNSDAQAVSDVGLSQRVYKLQAFISARYTTDGAGETCIEVDYQERRRRVLEALEDREPGIFVHPFEGEIRRLVCQEWELDEATNEVGLGRLTLTFIRDIPGARPVPADATAQAVLQAKLDLDLSLRQLVEDLYGVDLAFLDVAEQAIEAVTEAFAQVKDAVAFVENVAAEINGFAQTISDLTATVGAIITSPLAVVTAIRNAFTAAENIFPTLEAKFDAMVQGFDFSVPGPSASRSTPAALAAGRNRDALTVAVRAAFLGEAYTAAVGLELETLEEIERVTETLDAQHRLVAGDPTTTAELRASLQRIRVAFSDFMAARRKTALQVTSADIGPNTPRTLSFLFYGDDSRVADMAALNDLASYDLIDGTAKVLSR